MSSTRPSWASRCSAAGRGARTPSRWPEIALSAAPSRTSRSGPRASRSRCVGSSCALVPSRRSAWAGRPAEGATAAGMHRAGAGLSGGPRSPRAAGCGDALPAARPALPCGACGTRRAARRRPGPTAPRSPHGGRARIAPASRATTGRRVARRGAGQRSRSGRRHRRSAPARARDGRCRQHGRHVAGVRELVVRSGAGQPDREGLDRLQHHSRHHPDDQTGSRGRR